MRAGQFLVERDPQLRLGRAHTGKIVGVGHQGRAVENHIRRRRGQGVIVDDDDRRVQSGRCGVRHGEGQGDSIVGGIDFPGAEDWTVTGGAIGLIVATAHPGRALRAHGADTGSQGRQAGRLGLLGDSLRRVGRMWVQHDKSAVADLGPAADRIAVRADKRTIPQRTPIRAPCQTLVVGGRHGVGEGVLNELVSPVAGARHFMVIPRPGPLVVDANLPHVRAGFAAPDGGLEIVITARVLLGGDLRSRQAHFGIDG